MKRSSVLASGTIAGLILGSVLIATPALAATVEIGTDSDLLNFTSTCSGSNTVVLTADITLTERLAIGCPLVLDLAGYTLDSVGIDVETTQSLQIDDSGATSGHLNAITATFLDAGIGVPVGATLSITAGIVTATGGSHQGAGIGGGGYDIQASGTVTISGGTVTATGAPDAAGIGGSGAGGGTTTISGGTVTADGGFEAAGIGGGYFSDGGLISITGGSVTATSVGEGAGIGGGFQGSPGQITISGGTVSATGGSGGAGIGSGQGFSIGSGVRSLDVQGGTVTAIGGLGAAGIGGGLGSLGMPVSISSGAFVHASGFSAVGNGDAGARQEFHDFGSLTLGGTLEVDGLLTIPDPSVGAEVVIQPGGLILGAGSDPRAGASITGTGQIDNHGVIALDASHVMATIGVNDHSYDVTFDAQNGSTPVTVHLFAADFASGFRPFPTPPAGDEWNTAADGSGGWFTDHTVVSGDVTLYAAKAPIHTAALLANAVATCDTPVVLVADIALTDRLAIGCDLTLDLNGHVLTGPGIDVRPPYGLVVADSSGTHAGTLLMDGTGSGAGINVPRNASLVVSAGTINAVGGLRSAGIGGGGGSDSGTVTIQSGHVTATGGVGAAGIGGGWDGNSSATLISGGTVIARGGQDGAGIGAGQGGQAESMTINGGTVTATGLGTGPGIGGNAPGSPNGTVVVGGGVVTATGGVAAAGIGGGGNGYGAVVTIAQGATVLASGFSAIGVGFAAPAAGSFGVLTVAGTLEIGGPLVLNDDAGTTEITIASTALLREIGADPTGGVVATPDITGAGQIANHGAIAIDGSHFAPGVTVSDHNYVVTFNRQDGSTPASTRLLATTFTTGYRTFPAGTWNTAANQSGSAFLATTTVTASLTVYAPPPDADGDGVPNASDVCPNSDLSGASATKPKDVKPNNYWLTPFRTLTNGKTTYTLAQTGGCSAADIIMKLNLGKGQIKYGLAPGSLTTWLATLH